MAEHGPEPGTILNDTGEPTVPRQAATVLVLRGGAERLEVLLAQRTPKARFMGGAWVFPGGAVDAHEVEGAEAGEILMVFPTIKNLERVAGFGSADALLEWAGQREVRPVKPRVEGQGETARIVLDED